MPLVIQVNGRYAAPQVACDHCGELITDAQDGNYQWRALLQEDGACMPMVFTHKRCCEAFERTQENREGWQAIPLERLPYYLAQNLHVTWKTSQAIARLMTY